MKIGVDVRCLLAENYSGVSNYTWQLIRALVAKLPTDQFILQANSFKPVRVLSKIDEIKVKKSITRYPNKLLHLSMVLWQFPQLDRWLDGVDVYWVPGNNFISLSDQVAKVYTCHDLSWLVWPEFYSVRGKWWHRALQLEKKYTTAQKIIAVSECTKIDILNFFPQVKPDNVVVVPSGISYPQLTREQKVDVQRELSLPDRFLLYVGNIEPRKNVLGIIEAFKKLQIKYPDLYLVLAGGSGWYKKYSQQVQKAININNRIIYLGYVNEEQKWVLYSLAQVFLWPSFYEGFGFPPLEAMSQGCPVVVSQSASLPEVVAAAGILINPFDLQDLVLAVDSLLTNESWRQQLIARGYQRVKEFSWEKSAELTSKVFQSI